MSFCFRPGSVASRTLFRKACLAQAAEETLQVGFVLEGYALAPGTDGEVGPRFERQGCMGPRLVHLAELGMTGRDIGMVEGRSLGDPAVGVQRLAVAPGGVQKA